jgi:argininosuccinate lyase
MLKGLPLTYNRDLQEDKEPLFDSFRQVLLVLRALNGAYGSLEFRDEVAGVAADDELLVAIDIAEELVAEGLPFRQAHAQVGQLVGEAVASKRTLRDVVRSTAPFERFESLFEPGTALRRRRSPGASGPSSSQAQAEVLATMIAELTARL